MYVNGAFLGGRGNLYSNHFSLGLLLSFYCSMVRRYLKVPTLYRAGLEQEMSPLKVVDQLHFCIKPTPWLVQICFTHAFTNRSFQKILIPHLIRPIKQKFIG